MDGITTEPWAGLAKNIYNGATDMNARLDDLVDMARGEVGILKLRTEPLDMAPAIKLLAEEMLPLISFRQQTLKLELPPSLPYIMGDRTRLRQVLRNLINNATKFTPEKGKIVVYARAQAGNVVVEIQDNGRGIPPDRLANIFEPYSSVTSDTVSYQTGLGLGLKLSKTLVELHGGTISIKSEVGKGSTFSFSIPVISDVQNTGEKTGERQ